MLLKPYLCSFITAGIILVNWVTLAVELEKGVVVEVQFVKLGVLLGSWKLAGKKNISISRFVPYN
jgi:hypothetical protein